MDFEYVTYDIINKNIPFLSGCQDFNFEKFKIKYYKVESAKTVTTRTSEALLV
jgi:hypothetical protein